MHWIVTQDETCIHHFDPEDKKAMYAMEATWLNLPEKFKSFFSAQYKWPLVFGFVCAL